MGRGQPRKDPSKGLPLKSAGKSPKGGQGIQGKMPTRSNGNKQKISLKNTGKGESSLAKKGGAKVPVSDKKSKGDATKVKNVKWTWLMKTLDLNQCVLLKRDFLKTTMQ